MRDFTETQERLESQREDDTPVTAEEVTAPDGRGLGDAGGSGQGCVA